MAGGSRKIAGRLDLPDQTDLSFTTPHGVPGTGHWNFACAENSDLLEIRGERGVVAASCFGNEPLRVEIDGKTEFLNHPNPPHVHQPLIQTLVDELRGQGGDCPSTGISAARASQIIDQIGTL